VPPIRSHLWHYHLNLAHYRVMIGSFLQEARREGALVLCSLSPVLEAAAHGVAHEIGVTLVSLRPAEGVDASIRDAIASASPGNFTSVWWVGDSGSAAVGTSALCPAVAAILPPDSVMLCCAGPVTDELRPVTIPPELTWPAGHRYYETGGPITTWRWCASDPCARPG
jgi:hypothetical protein